MVTRAIREPEPGEMVIFRMTIKTRTGRVIRRANGQPFRLIVKAQV